MTGNSFQLPQQSPQAAPALALPRPDQVSPARALLGVVMPVLGALLTTLDLQMTNAALTEQIQGALGFTADEATWISVAYISAEVIIIPLAGWLSRACSRRWYLVVNATLFVCVSIACALAWDLPSLIVFRTLQGLVAGGFTVLAFTMVLTQMPRSKQNIGFVMVSVTSGLPVPIGPLLAGWLIDNYNWHYIYYLNVPLGLLLIAGLWRWIDPQPLRLSLLRQIDWLGAMVMAVGVLCLVTVLERGNTENWFDSDQIVLLSVISVLLLAGFCWIELNCRQPLIDLRLLGQRHFAFANAINFCVGIILAYGYVMTVYLGQIQGYNSVQIGAVLIWGSIVNPTVPKLIEHVENRLLLGIAIALFVTSCFMNSALTHDVAAHELVWSQVVRALGQPMLIAVIAFIATDNIKKEQAESASAIFNLVRTLGATMGTATLGTLLTRREQFHSNRLVESVSMSSQQTLERLQQLSLSFTSKLGDPAAAQEQAMSAVGQTVRREANVLAFSDCFYFIGIAIILSGLFILGLKKSSKPALP